MRISSTTRRRLALGACLLHLGVIGGYAGNAALSERKPASGQASTNVATALIKLYTVYTAFQADYGFFSPEIGSSHELEISVTDGRGTEHPMRLDPANREVSVRYSTLLLIFTHDRDYQELLGRSIAAMAHKQFPDAARITVSVYRHQLPALAEYRAGQRPSRVLYFQGVYDTVASTAARSE